MSELLLELFSEEIPAMMQEKAANSYLDIFTNYFNDQKIEFDKIDVYVGPRRLTICVSGLPASIPPSVEKLKGPKTSAPEMAITGFCKSNNIDLDFLEREEIKGIEFYVYNKKSPEKLIYDILIENIGLPISKYVWPKSMYWGSYDIKWVRPLRNILCIFDGKILPFKYGHLVANNISYGHRFASPNSSKITSLETYREFLDKSFVILDHNTRKEIIQRDIDKEAKSLNLEIQQDQALLNEVNGLVEHPKVLVGKIDKKFLALPSEILVAAMRGHQKYFSLFDENGNFAPYFLFVSNVVSDNYDVVISGNEKVLSARLSDALFFYQQDLKTTLKEKSQGLDKVIFHAKLGNLKEKTLRLGQIIKFIEPDNKIAQNAALICKSDILSEAVDEFPALQGVMGYYYAKSESLDEKIAIALRDHYKPQGPSDNCPEGSAAILALADKIDSLCGLIFAGDKPTGSKDPFALRRGALGIIRIIFANNLSINLIELIKFSAKTYANKLTITNEDINQVVMFFEDRIKYYFKDKYSHQIISSVLNLQNEHDIIEIKSKLDSLNDFLKTKDGSDLLTAYKRASNILGKEILEGEAKKDLFASKHETALFECVEECDKKIESLLAEKKYNKIMRLLATIHDPMTHFFENIMVKDPDEKIARNRMLLLQKTKNLFDQIADFSKL